MINFKELNLSLEETGTFTQIMDPSLGYIVVGNLLRNALFHNKEHGKVTIHIAPNTFRIANSGLKAPLNQEKLFTRFHKNESSTNGSGLGLAIVKAICELYQLQASYTYEQEEHVFTIKKKA